MKIEELQLGNIVYSGETSKFPMRVTGIYDGVVRLDFTGNEGGPWEVDPSTLSPVELSVGLLGKIGFVGLGGKLYGLKACIRHRPYKLFRGQDVYNEFEFLIEKDASTRGVWETIHYLHELQNLYMENFHEIFPINDEDIVKNPSKAAQPKQEQQGDKNPDAEQPEDKQLQLDKRYLRMAFVWAENSHAKRRQVASFIVKDQMIVSDGYNGTPAGFPNQCEDENNVTKPCVLHAEANAITKLAKYGNSCAGATIYITDEPCIDCAKLIIQSGIKRVVYCREYRIHAGIELLAEANIQVDHIELDDAPEVPCP